MRRQIEERSQLLADDKWLQLRKIVFPEENIHGYVYSHEISCQGNKVCFLPFKKNVIGDYEYLLRKEAVPCWELGAPLYSAFTGSCEPNLTFEETFIKELREESGYSLDEEESWRIIRLGFSFGTKSTDTIYHLFSVDLTDFPQNKIVDLFVETDLDKTSTNEWLSLYQLMNEVNEPFTYMIMCRLAADS